jgi:hypothetical protein
MPARTPEQIRASIESNREELAVSLLKLRGEVTVLTDWRGRFRAHRRELLIGAAIGGFVLGGGFAALGGVLSRRRG